MGTGIFNLPLRIDEVGILPFICFALLAAIFSAVGNHFITHLIVRKKFKSYS